MLEDKDQVKRRIGRSPDLADALALTFGMVEMPQGFAGTRQATVKLPTYAPFGGLFDGENV